MAFSLKLWQGYERKHEKSHDYRILYGTVGPRALADDIDSFVFRMGTLAAIRSKVMKGKVIGMMITGGHNPEEDNGIKFVDSDGFVLDETWERLCNKYGNEMEENIEGATRKLYDGLSPDEVENIGLVYIAMDSRVTSPQLVDAAACGVKAVGGAVRELALLTTAQLHYIVYIKNKGLPDASEAGYFKRTTDAYKELFAEIRMCAYEKYDMHVNVDVGHGVGGHKLERAQKLLTRQLKMNLHNLRLGTVNYRCGAHWVETEIKRPQGCSVEPGSRWCSISADAGRIVYFYADVARRLQIVHGDKIAALICIYIKELLVVAELTDIISYQVVLTPYANSRTVAFLRDYVKTTVDIAAPGLKNLMKKAVNRDISICYERNGRGTVFCNDKMLRLIKNRMENDETRACKLLYRVLDLMPQTHDDSFCTLLLVESILRAKDWSIEHWDTIYESNPTRTVTLKAKDRFYVKTNLDCSEVIEPEDLKKDLRLLLTRYTEGCRVVIRPSGTENYIKIFAEADSQYNADQLANAARDIVDFHAEHEP